MSSEFTELQWEIDRQLEEQKSAKNRMKSKVIKYYLTFIFIIIVVIKFKTIKMK